MNGYGCPQVCAHRFADLDQRRCPASRPPYSERRVVPPEIACLSRLSSGSLPGRLSVSVSTIRSVLIFSSSELVWGTVEFGIVPIYDFELRPSVLKPPGDYSVQTYQTAVAVGQRSPYQLSTLFISRCYQQGHLRPAWIYGSSAIKCSGTPGTTFR